MDLGVRRQPGRSLAVHGFSAADSLSVRQARRMMRVLTQADAEAIRRGRNELAHGSSRALERHPLAAMEPEERAELVLSVSQRLPDGPVAASFRRIAEDIRALGDRHTAASCHLAGMVLEVVWILWRSAERIGDLEAEQQERIRRHPRRMRMLDSAEVPLWVLGALQGMSTADLRTLTPEALLALAGLEDADGPDRHDGRLLSQARAALRVLRLLALLGVEPPCLNELLALLVVSIRGHDDTSPAVQGVPVPVRPCHPPGELVLAEPRVPRAPGCAVFRRFIDRDRHQLHRCGVRGRRLTA